MAKRHNAYGRLLGTVENDGWDMGRNDVSVIADDCEDMASSLHAHADRLATHADTLRDFNSGIPEGLIPEGDTGLPEDVY